VRGWVLNVRHAWIFTLAHDLDPISGRVKKWGFKDGLKNPVVIALVSRVGGEPTWSEPHDFELYAVILSISKTAPMF